MMGGAEEWLFLDDETWLLDGSPFAGPILVFLASMTVSPQHQAA